MTSLHILHLFPSELGINGDVGNVTALRHRAVAFGLDVETSVLGRGESIPSDVDLVHIGSGPTAELSLVLPELVRHSAQLKTLRDSGVPFLAISAGWFGLGERIQFASGESERGAGVFPTQTQLLDSRVVGEIAIDTQWGTVTGFENHSALVSDGGLPHFGRVTHGTGSDPRAAKSDRWEGVVMGSSIGTNMHGSLLPMNPVLADQLILSAVRRSVPNWTIPTTDALAEVDAFAAKSRAAVLARL